MFVTDGEVEPAGMQAIEALIVNEVLASAEYCKTTSSTNTRALVDVRNGSIDEASLPKCYLTDGQTAGRGRHGRSWQSDGGTLTFSVVMKSCISNIRHMQILPLAVGLGIARFIDFEFAPLQAKLKWPNDVNIGGGKVAGVLLETSGDSLGLTVIGVGMNVSSEPGLDNNPQGISVRSLTQVVGRKIRRYDVFAPLMESIVQTINESHNDFKVIIDEFRRRCLLTGQEISFRHQNRECVGVCEGISEDGALLVSTPRGMQVINSGEARLVRITKR